VQFGRFDPYGLVWQTFWRGDALTDVATERFALGEIARLNELHLSATEDRIEAGLALGRHGELVAVLEPLVAADPLRERMRGQLMLALYRCGRQADALRSYREGRSAMVQDLGIEPSPVLRRLEEEILLQSPSLDWRPGPAAPGAGACGSPARGRAHGALSGARPRRRTSRPGRAKHARGP
jgi:SARP family transcriptional regulator, regulator of embCAB operon